MGLESNAGRGGYSSARGSGAWGILISKGKRSVGGYSMRESGVWGIFGEGKRSVGVLVGESKGDTCKRRREGSAGKVLDHRHCCKQ